MDTSGKHMEKFECMCRCNVGMGASENTWRKNGKTQLKREGHRTCPCYSEDGARYSEVHFWAKARMGSVWDLGFSLEMLLLPTKVDEYPYII